MRRILGRAASAGTCLVLVTCGPATETGTAERSGYVLRPEEGERLRGGAITVKASPETGSHRAAMFTQVLEPQSQIPLHVHHRVDEFFFVHRGSGTAVLGDERVPIREGDVVFVPEGSDHKIENSGSDNELELVIFVSQPGLEAMFREVDRRMRDNPEPMTLEELNEIARRHGDLYKEMSRSRE